jgi:hypothetical protein
MSIHISTSDRRPSYLESREAGEDALRKKQFELAQNIFEQALREAVQASKSQRSVLIPILDLQAEAHIQLNRLDAALQQGRAMVEHDRTDPRGYLRCGQISVIRKDYARAQRWYNHGLKHSITSSPQFASLKSMSSKTKAKLSRAVLEPKRCDPFSILPLDLIHMICERLGFREGVKCLRVSRTWRDVLISVPSIWKTLDLTGDGDTVSLLAVKACVRRLSTPPTTVNLRGLTQPAFKYLGPYLERWKDMHHLSIEFSEQPKPGQTWTVALSLRTLFADFRCRVDFKAVCGLLYRCQRLQSARFHNILGMSRRHPDLVEVKTLCCRSQIMPELVELELLHYVSGPCLENMDGSDQVEIVSRRMSY